MQLKLLYQSLWKVDNLIPYLFSLFYLRLCIRCAARCKYFVFRNLVKRTFGSLVWCFPLGMGSSPQLCVSTTLPSAWSFFLITTCLVVLWNQFNRTLNKLT